MKKTGFYSALKSKSDEELKQHLFKVIRETAKKNGKDIYSISLEDVYQALTEIRNSWYGFILRKIKLSQFITIKKTTDKIGQAVTVTSSFMNPIYLVFLPVKKYVGFKVKNLGWHLGAKWFANKIYKQKKKEVQKAKNRKSQSSPSFMRNLKTTPKLKEVIGSSSVPRPHAIKKIWEYIRKHKFQDRKKHNQITVGGTVFRKLFSGKKKA